MLVGCVVICGIASERAAKDPRTRIEEKGRTRSRSLAWQLVTWKRTKRPTAIRRGEGVEEDSRRHEVSNWCSFGFLCDYALVWNWFCTTRTGLLREKKWQKVFEGTVLKICHREWVMLFLQLETNFATLSVLSSRESFIISSRHSKWCLYGIQQKWRDLK